MIISSFHNQRRIIAAIWLVDYYSYQDAFRPDFQCAWQILTCDCWDVIPSTCHFKDTFLCENVTISWENCNGFSSCLNGSVVHYDIGIFRNLNGISPHGELEEMPLSLEIDNSRSTETKRSLRDIGCLFYCLHFQSKVNECAWPRKFTSRFFKHTLK